jgi:hypothetical protein
MWMSLSGTDIPTLAKTMGTSVRTLELHYSKLIATMSAERFTKKIGDKQ